MSEERVEYKTNTNISESTEENNNLRSGSMKQRSFDIEGKTVLNKAALDVIKINLHEALTRGAVRRELINIPSYLRHIGKTTALVAFAEEFHLSVVVKTEEQALELRKKYGDFIYSQAELERSIPAKGAAKLIVTDEGVDIGMIKQKLPHYDIVTGFISKF